MDNEELICKGCKESLDLGKCTDMFCVNDPDIIKGTNVAAKFVGMSEKAFHTAAYRNKVPHWRGGNSGKIYYFSKKRLLAWKKVYGKLYYPLPLYKRTIGPPMSQATRTRRRTRPSKRK